MTPNLFQNAKNEIIKPMKQLILGLMCISSVVACKQDNKNSEAVKSILAKTEKVDPAKILAIYKEDEKTHTALVERVKNEIDVDKNDTITRYEFKRMQKMVKATSTESLTHDLGYGAFTDFEITTANGETEVEMKHNDIHITSLSKNAKLFSKQEPYGKKIQIVDENDKEKTVTASYQSTTVFPKYN